MNHSSPTNQLHKTSHIFILERAKPRRVSNFHPANIHFNSCWATPNTIRSTLRSFHRKLLSISSRIGLVAVLFLRLEPTRIDLAFWSAPSPSFASQTGRQYNDNQTRPHILCIAEACDGSSARELCLHLAALPGLVTTR